MKDTSLSQKQEKLTQKVEAFRAELRTLQDGSCEKKCGFLVLFPDQMQDSESLMARAFSGIPPVDASVFLVTEELMDTLDRLDVKYAKLQKKIQKLSEVAEKKPKKETKNEKKEEIFEEEVIEMVITPKKTPASKKSPTPKASASSPVKKTSTRKASPAKKTASSSRKK